jgi:hypothetical protein
MAVTLLSCGGRKTRPNQRLTFWRKDKIPYGTYIAYESLPFLFRNAEISVNRKEITNLPQNEGKKALIFIGHFVDPDPAGINALLNFVGDGNHVFLSALYFGDSLLHALNVRLGSEHGVDLTTFKDSLRVSIYQPVTGDSLSFAYPGLALDSWVDTMDSKYATVLGRDGKGRPNLIKFRYKGGGTLLLHFAPLAFTNYFLMHKGNKVYYDNALSYIPENVNEVIWDESFRYYSRNNSRGNFSALRYILNSPPLRWGFWLLLLLFVIIYLFESKRRQRIVPLITGLRNTSLDFVTTIGRLYYERRDNQNLSVKMITHFQDHIRTKYNLSVHLSDPEFAERLSYKTGISKEFLNVMVGDMLRMQNSGTVSDTELLELNKKLDEFYKQA